MLTHGRNHGPPQRSALSREQVEELLALLAELRARGVEVEAETDGDRLRLSAASGVLAGLEPALHERVRAAKPALLAFLAASGASDSRRRSRPTRGTGSGRAPLSFAQQRLWLLQQIQPDSSVYNLPYAFRIEGALDAQALSDSLDDLVERHESLRTTMAAGAGRGAEPGQRVGPRPRGLLARVDLRAEPQRLTELLELESALPFDLERGPLLRAALIGLGHDEHVLFLNVHHIVCDGWSIEILLDELGRSYEARLRGERAALPPLSIQYADFARWERSTVTPETQAAALTFHRGQLAGALEPLELPADHPRPKVFRHRGRAHRFEVEGPLVAALGELGQRHHATTFMVMLAAFKLLLAREARRREVVVGTPMAGRLHAETEPLIGFFANTVVLRSSLGDDPSFVEFLGRVRATCLAAYEHQVLPFQWLVDALELPRDSSRTPVFQAMFTFQDTRSRRLDRGGLRWTRLDLDSGGSKTDVTLLLEEHEQGMSAWLEYSTELFERATIERFARRYVALLESIVENPRLPVSRLDLERRGLGAPRARRASDVPGDAPGEASGEASSDAAGQTSRDARSEPPPQAAQARAATDTTHVVPLSATGGREPLFCFGGLDLYRALARRVAAIRPVSGVVLSSQPADVPALARECVAAVRAQQPHGPYHFAGFAFGGVLAYETAQQLMEAGEGVALLAMIDVALPQLLRRAPVDWLRDRVGLLLGRDRRPHAESIPAADVLGGLELPRHDAVCNGYLRQLRPWSGPLLVIRARQPRPAAGAAPPPADGGWGPFVPSGELSVHELGGEHSELLREPQVEELARVLREHIDAPGRAQGGPHAAGD